MTERPILFSGAMVRAILAGQKTQTRRIIKPSPPRVMEAPQGHEFSVAGHDHRCPYGQPGDRLWVRETWRPVMEAWRSFVEYAAEGPTLDNIHRDLMAPLNRLALRFPGARKDRHSEVWHPSIHMPRWASRILLEVKAVRVERLQDISEGDARAEGVEPRIVSHGPPELKGYVLGFKDLWREINGAESWAANPWVWVIEFERVQ